MKLFTFFAASIALSLSFAAHAQPCDSMLADLSAWRARSQPRGTMYAVRVFMTTNSKKNWMGAAQGDMKSGLSGELTQTFSDRFVPNSNSQNFDANKGDGVGIKLLPGNRVELNFITWNYKTTLNVTCSNGFMYGEQGQEFHVFSFRKYTYEDIR